MRKNSLKWYGHALRRSPDAIIGKGEIINLSDTRSERRRPKMTLIETINKDLTILNLIKYMTFYGSQW